MMLDPSHPGSPRPAHWRSAHRPARSSRGQDWATSGSCQDRKPDATSGNDRGQRTERGDFRRLGGRALRGLESGSVWAMLDLGMGSSTACGGGPGAPGAGFRHSLGHPSRQGIENARERVWHCDCPSTLSHPTGELDHTTGDGLNLIATGGIPHAVRASRPFVHATFVQLTLDRAGPIVGARRGSGASRPNSRHVTRLPCSMPL
jgi:hypothetical protein